MERNVIIDPTNYIMKETPFRYAVSDDGFNMEVADDLGREIKKLPFITYDEGLPYERVAVHLMPQLEYSKPLLKHFSKDTLNNLKCGIELLFNVNILRKTMIMAHCLSPGQFLNIHSDWNAKGTNPDFRFVVILEHDTTMSLTGGSLMTFRVNENGNRFEPYFKYKVKHGSSYFLEFSEHSYHAVEPVKGGVRYSLLFSFWKDKLEYLFPQSTFSF